MASFKYTAVRQHWIVYSTVEEGACARPFANHLFSTRAEAEDVLGKLKFLIKERSAAYGDYGEPLLDIVTASVDADLFVQPGDLSTLFYVDEDDGTGAHADWVELHTPGTTLCLKYQAAVAEAAAEARRGKLKRILELETEAARLRSEYAAGV
jgi:hypothetical protein